MYHADALAVPRTYGQIRPLLCAGLPQSRQILRIVGKVGIHFENIVVTLLQCPFEACDIGGSESKFAASFNQMQSSGIIPLSGLKFFLQVFHNSGSPVRRAVVNHQHVVTSLDAEDCVYDFCYVLLFVVCGDDYDFPVHITQIIKIMRRKFSNFALQIHLLY